MFITSCVPVVYCRPVGGGSGGRNRRDGSKLRDQCITEETDRRCLIQMAFVGVGTIEEIEIIVSKNTVYVIQVRRYARFVTNTNTAIYCVNPYTKSHLIIDFQGGELVGGLGPGVKTGVHFVGTSILRRRFAGGWGILSVVLQACV